MSQDIAAQKQALRQQIGDLRARFSTPERVAASARLCEQLCQQTIWQECRSVLFFAPRPEEPDIRPLLEEAWREGKIVVLPRFAAERQDYDLCRVAGLAWLEPGHFGIMEPGRESPVFELNQLDFLLVPGLAFDPVGRRLGRGKGFFDRLLARVRGHKCGVAFDWQLVSEVPVEPHDIHVNSLLTPSRWTRCAEPRAV